MILLQSIRGQARVGLLRTAAAGAFSILLAPLSAAQSPNDSAVEPLARKILQSSSDFLSRLPSFGFSVEETFDQFEGIQRLHLSNTRSVAVRRPDRLAVDSAGDILNRSLWYDGKSVVLMNREGNTYSVLEAPDSLDSTLDHLDRKYGIVLPLSDLMHSHVFKAALSKARTGTYVGIGRVGNLNCHHLAFTQETIDWQIWIDTGAAPLPRKLAIVYKEEPEDPQYWASFTEWNVTLEAGDQLFKFETPSGGRRIELQPIMAADPLADNQE